MGGSGIQVGALAAPANLSSELSRSLAVMIRSGSLKPGDRLPTEQELMRQAGVSRTVVREAVAALRAEGLVTTRQGVGAFVAQTAAVGPFRIEPGQLEDLQQVLHVMELRIGIEVEAAGLAAERRDPEALARIEDAHRTFSQAAEGGDVAVEADFAFHRAVLDATGNPYFPRFLDFLGQIIIPRQSVRFGVTGDRRPYLARLRDEHLAILLAVRARDVSSARATMHGHLTAGRERYLRLAADLKAAASPSR